MSKYYDSIDEIPLFNWWKIRDGEYKYARIDLDHGSREQDVKAFIRINDSYMAEFGLDTEMERVIELKREIAIMQCDFVTSGDNFLRNNIRRLELELP